MSDRRGKLLSFGPFELSIGNKLLTNGAKVVPLGAPAMDLLIVLVEQANKVVGRRTLIKRVWPKGEAKQVSLRVHISALRTALDQSDPGRRYIANVPGQGYSFVVPVTSLSSLSSGDLKPSSRSRIPARLMRMLGRRDTLAAIQMKLDEQLIVFMRATFWSATQTSNERNLPRPRAGASGAKRTIDVHYIGWASSLPTAGYSLMFVPSDAIW